MATLEAWLGPGLFKALGPYLEDELGVDEVGDLRFLEPAQLKAVRAKLKPVQLKKFDFKYSELTGGAASAAAPASPGYRRGWMRSRWATPVVVDAVGLVMMMATKVRMMRMLQ